MFFEVPALLNKIPAKPNIIVRVIVRRSNDTLIKGGVVVIIVVVVGR